MIVVSANYLNRGAEDKWLMRESEQKPEESTTCKAIVATGITFQQSSVERGFGCRMVAMCESATQHDSLTEREIAEDEEEIPLRFDGRCFVSELNQKYVHSCDELRLSPDGRMVAIVKRETPVPA
jgi:hypothetical protein